MPNSAIPKSVNIQDFRKRKNALVHTSLCLRMALLHHRHRLYSALDDLLDICGVYKVETIGGENA